MNPNVVYVHKMNHGEFRFARLTMQCVVTNAALFVDILLKKGLFKRPVFLTKVISNVFQNRMTLVKKSPPSPPRW